MKDKKIKKLFFAGNCGGKKAIIFTIDAVLALVVVMIMAFAINNYFSHKIDYTNSDADIFAQDSLSVMEKSGLLANSSNYNIMDYIAAMPQQVCMNLTINSQVKNIYATQGCDMSNASQIAVANRVFIQGQNIYYATAMVWYKSAN